MVYVAGPILYTTIICMYIHIHTYSIYILLSVLDSVVVRLPPFMWVTWVQILTPLKVLPPVGVLRQDPLTLPAYQCKSLWIKANRICIKINIQSMLWGEPKCRTKQAGGQQGSEGKAATAGNPRRNRAEVNNMSSWYTGPTQRIWQIKMKAKKYT